MRVPHTSATWVSERCEATLSTQQARLLLQTSGRCCAKLFFAAFLPQFMQPTAAPVLQALALGTVFVAVAAASDSGYVLLASALSPALRASRGAIGVGQYVPAAVYFALGVYAALSGARPGRA
jgi:hypothetical protein